MAYLPRCADRDAEVRKVAIQVCAVLLSVTACFDPFMQCTIFHFVIYVCSAVEYLLFHRRQHNHTLYNKIVQTIITS